MPRPISCGASGAPSCRAEPLTRPQVGPLRCPRRWSFAASRGAFAMGASKRYRALRWFERAAQRFSEKQGGSASGREADAADCQGGGARRRQCAARCESARGGARHPLRTRRGHRAHIAALSGSVAFRLVAACRCAPPPRRGPQQSAPMAECATRTGKPAFVPALVILRWLAGVEVLAPICGSLQDTSLVESYGADRRW